jgi:hypothetical protein
MSKAAAGTPRFEPAISIADSDGFNPKELSNILQVVEDNRVSLLKAWHDHCGN